VKIHLRAQMYADWRKESETGVSIDIGPTGISPMPRWLVATFQLPFCYRRWLLWVTSSLPWLSTSLWLSRLWLLA